MKEKSDIRGFVDLQVNGYKGIDFSSPDLTEEAFVFACRELEKKGTVAFLPTIISSAPEIYQKNLRIISRIMRREEFAQMLPGIHLEGPFISAENGYKGVHPFQQIRRPDLEILKQLIKWSDHQIRMLTIAAELVGADKICKYAVSKNIIVSLGHQDANEKQINRLAEKGASSLTHLGNGIPHLINRHINPIWAGLGNEKLTAMIVADGFHLPVSLIQTILKVKGAKQTIMVSDLSPLGGLKPGNYKIWGADVVLSQKGFLYDPQTGYLAASSLSLLDCVNWLLSKEILRFKDIYRMAFQNPAEFIGLDLKSFKKSKKFRLRDNQILIDS